MKITGSFAPTGARKFIDINGGAFASAEVPAHPSTDCGLGGRVHKQIAWAKLETLAKGAEIASKRLFN